VKLFFDEDIGPTVARLVQEQLPEDEIDYVAAGRSIAKGTADVVWLRYAGNNNFMAISQNRKILRVPHELAVILEAKVGMIFVPANIPLDGKVRMLVSRARWLRGTHTGRPRPFALYLQKSGGVYEHRLRR
jgi:predicted nuclease of predicted toxin-antitoxin system